MVARLGRVDPRSTNVGFGLGGLLVGWIHIRKTGSYYVWVSLQLI